MNPNLIHQNEKFPHELFAYIEVQKNTRTKYEYDEKLNGSKLSEGYFF